MPMFLLKMMTETIESVCSQSKETSFLSNFVNVGKFTISVIRALPTVSRPSINNRSQQQLQ